MTPTLILTGLMVFLAETCSLCLGTVRTIITVQGNARLALALGTLEMLIWLVGTATVMVQVGQAPFLGVCYALGFGCGNALGILAERRLAMGNLVVRIISLCRGEAIARRLRGLGFCVTELPGQGASGPVSVLFIVCRRRDLKRLLDAAQAVDPSAFHTFDAAAGANRVHGPCGNSVAARPGGGLPQEAAGDTGPAVPVRRRLRLLPLG